MTHQQLQNAILDCTPPGLWKQAVKEMSHVFTEKELMMIAYQQTATFESRMKAMDLLGKYASPPAAAFVRKMIPKFRKDLEMFQKAESGYIYELWVNTVVDSWDKNYICDSYEAAIRMFSYIQEQDFSEEEIVGYTIYKRKMVTKYYPAKADIPPDPNDPEAEEWEYMYHMNVGECKFGAGRLWGAAEPVLLSVDCYPRLYSLNESPDDCGTISTEFCSVCDEYCLGGELRFPNFLKPGDIVRYQHSYDLQGNPVFEYAIHMVWNPLTYGKEPLTVCCFVPLSQEMFHDVEKESFMNYVNYNYDHLPVTEIDKILPVEELPEELQQGCRACLEEYRNYVMELKAKEINKEDIL